MINLLLLLCVVGFVVEVVIQLTRPKNKWQNKKKSIG